MFRIHTVIALACCAALTGCLVPEKFSASADFKTDGSYRYQFDGTVVNALAAMEIQKNGKLSDQDRAKVQKALDKEASRPGMQKLQATSDTRYALKYDGELKMNEKHSGSPYFVLNVSTRDWKERRVLTVSGPQIKPKEQKELEQLGIKPSGKIAITLPADAKVLQHNAKGTPGLLSKAYTWDVGSLGDKPSIQFQLP
ncbi:MAG: hypothetical protein RSD57_17620 [Comamonas sp.]